MITVAFHQAIVREALFQGLTPADFVRAGALQRVKRAFRRRDAGGQPRPKQPSRRGLLLADELDSFG